MKIIIVVVCLFGLAGCNNLLMVNTYEKADYAEPSFNADLLECREKSKRLVETADDNETVGSCMASKGYKVGQKVRPLM